MTRNPPPRSSPLDLGDQVRAEARCFGLSPAAHLFCVDARSEISPAFLTQAEVARLLGVPARTLEGWRLTASGPPWLKLGRHVRYDQEDVLAWAREQRRG